MKRLLGLRIALFLDVVGDGEWHELAKLPQKLMLSELKVQSIALFLNKFGFGLFDKANLKFRINKDFQGLLART